MHPVLVRGVIWLYLPTVVVTNEPVWLLVKSSHVLNHMNFPQATDETVPVVAGGYPSVNACHMTKGIPKRITCIFAVVAYIEWHFTL